MFFTKQVERCDEVTHCMNWSRKNQKKRTEIIMTILKRLHTSWVLSEMKGATHSLEAQQMHKTALCASFLNC